jgi:hypothetical protein
VTNSAIASGPGPVVPFQRWRGCVRDFVHGTRTSSSKPSSIRVDSVGAPPRVLSIWDAHLGPSGRGEIIWSREPERHIWMGPDQGDLDIPVLLEVRHFLDQTAKAPPFTHDAQDELQESWAEPGPALLALPEDDHLSASRGRARHPEHPLTVWTADRPPEERPTRSMPGSGRDSVPSPRPP